MRFSLFSSLLLLAAVVQSAPAAPAAPTTPRTIAEGATPAAVTVALDNLAAKSPAIPREINATPDAKAAPPGAPPAAGTAPPTDFPAVHEPKEYGVLAASQKDVQHLALLAKYAMAAYDIDKIEKWTCDLCQKPELKNAKPQYVHNDKVTGLEFYIAVNDDQKAIIVAFAGTNDKHDVLTDIDYPKWPLFGTNPKVSLVQPKPLDNWKGIDISTVYVHRGFFELYLTGREAMMKKVLELHNDPKYAKYITHVTGHSLGGALTTLASFDIARTFERGSVLATTFASPRVGDFGFAKLYRNIPGLAQNRYVFASDVVPHLPPYAFGFVHVGQEFWVPSADSSAVLRCRIQSDYTEDPDCAARVRPTPSKEMHSSVIGYNKITQ